MTKFVCHVGVKATAIAVLLLMLNIPSAAQVETTLVRFDGATDGGGPFSPLLADSEQNLYGTTSWSGALDPNCYGFNGGSMDCGTVFRLSPPQQTGGPWTETVLYTFTGGTDGAYPYGPLAMDKAGNIYGATAYGGGLRDMGTIYQLAPPVNPGDPWTETILYSFTGVDGDFPNGVTIDAAGNLFGTTEFGGCNLGQGTAFELSPPSMPGNPWTLQVLYSFHCKGNSDPDGIDPFGALIQGSGGSFYGTTQYSGTGMGTVFRLDPPPPGKTAWVEKILYTFQGDADGAYPIAALTQNRGKLYGTTTYGTCSGCGTIFQLTPPPDPSGSWTKTTIYSFTGGTDGKFPTYGVSFDNQGNLYGATFDGGNSTCRSPNMSACGVVYKLAPPVNPGDPWTQTVLHAFVGVQDGSFPSGPVLIGRAGALYGIARSGGDLSCSIDKSKGCGTVYRIVP